MTYEYLCSACGHQWEADQRISEAPLKDCPDCHAASAKRQISVGAGFILKGGGWYSDGYTSSNGAKKSESSKPSDTSAKSESSKRESSSPTKPSDASGKAAA